MSLYRWSMKAASRILFWISAVLFTLGILQAFYVLKESVFSEGPAAIGVAALLLVLNGTSLGAAVLPFIGAVAIERWDRRSQ